LLGLAHLTFAGVLALWFLGVLQPIELKLYDTMISVRSALRPMEAPIVLVGTYESDLNRFNWPLPDDKLAEAIDRLELLGARVIGVDLYRDQPRGQGAAALEDSLRRNHNVIVITKFAADGEMAIGPPKILAGTTQFGFADIPADRDGVVRRGLLYLDDGATSVESFSLRLAEGFLASRDIRPEPGIKNPENLKFGKAEFEPFTGGGGYVRADPRGYQLQLDFPGGPHPFATISLSELLDGNARPELVRGRVVIIGQMAESVKDMFQVPVTSLGGGATATIYGTEIHAYLTAQVIQAALLGDSAGNQGAPIPLIVLVIWITTVAGGLSAAWVKSARMLALIVSTGFVLVLSIAFILFMNSFWLPVGAPILGWFGGAILPPAVLWSRERQHRRHLMQVFSQSVSPAIARKLWQHRETFMAGDRPKPQRLTVTVLFTDLRDFTTISESLDPSDLLSWLDTYMSIMTDIVVRHDGIINKFIGDSIMAIFGVPIARRTQKEIAADARRAANCALAMAKALEDLNQRWAKNGQTTVGMRVGIHTGPVVAGTMGSRNRLEYTIIGDTVNTASRLESFDKSVGSDLTCRIIVSEATLSLLGGGVAADPVGAVSLKGKAQPVSVYVLHPFDSVVLREKHHA
jgi:adenylate cyclase